MDAARFAGLSAELDGLLTQRGREPSSVRRTLMTRAFYGRDAAEVEAVSRGRERRELRSQGLLVGTAEDIAEQLDRLEKAGVERVMLQWMETEDLGRLEAFAQKVLTLLK